MRDDGARRGGGGLSSIHLVLAASSPFQNRGSRAPPQSFVGSILSEDKMRAQMLCSPFVCSRKKERNLFQRVNFFSL